MRIQAVITEWSLYEANYGTVQIPELPVVVRLFSQFKCKQKRMILWKRLCVLKVYEVHLYYAKCWYGK